MKDVITAVIIDDEPLARKLLRGLLNDNCPEVNVLAECGDLPEGVKAIRKQKPDIVFLDIEMPGHSGTELLDFFDENEITFSVIFTTAYNEYAIKALKMSALDYLLKPIEPAELVTAVEKFRKQEGKMNVEKLKQAFAPQHDSRIAVPTQNGMKFLEPSQIEYLKAENSYTELTIHEGGKLLVSRTLKNFEDSLASDPHFFRCHKSWIVNLAFVTEYTRTDGGFLIMKDGTEIPITQEKVQEFMEKVTIIKR